MNVFETEDRFPGAMSQTLKSLKRMDLSAYWFTRAVAAAKASGCEFKAPFWKDDVFAHIGFPSHKIVVVIGYQLSWINDRGFRQKWERHGFKVFGTTSRAMGRVPTEDLAEQLREAIKKERTK